LVTHGPLLAQLLMLMAARKLGRLQGFSFRATSPLMHTERAQFCWAKGGQMWVRGPDGRQCMSAHAE
jgi:3-methylfumaryl-CoA hydratase